MLRYQLTVNRHVFSPTPNQGGLNEVPIQACSTAGAGTSRGRAGVLGAGFWGCSDKEESPTTPQTPPEMGMFTASNPMVQSVMAVQDRHTARLMADPEIIGTATTLTDDGRLAVMVLATTDRAAKEVPSELDGVPVVVHRTEKIVAMKTTTVSHTAKQTPPIQLGTSGGWRYDLANGYCCGGTLGSLIQVGGQKRILSNYHVFEADIVSRRQQPRGDRPATPIIQPGLIDVGCVATSAQNVATLVKSQLASEQQRGLLHARRSSPAWSPRTARSSRSARSPAQTVAASVGQLVKKSGRTTGLTRSKVSGLNAHRQHHVRERVRRRHRVHEDLHRSDPRHKNGEQVPRRRRLRFADGPGRDHQSARGRPAVRRQQLACHRQPDRTRCSRSSAPPWLDNSV